MVNRMSFKDQLLQYKHSLVYPQAIAAYQRLLQSQNWSRDEMHDWQSRRLRRLLSHAWGYSPFYRRRLDEAGVHPCDIRGPEDLCRLPVLTRRDIRNHFNEIAIRNVPGRLLKESTTGGTTGIPVRTLLDRRAPHAALGWRMLSWWGYGPAVSMGMIWRESDSSFFRRCLNRIIAWPASSVRLDASAITPDSMERFIQRCQRRRITLLHGYTGAIHHLAAYLQKRGGEYWRPRLVWVTCSPLSQPHRKLMEQVFQAPVLDQYGSCEVYWIAAQCAHSSPNLHLFAESRLVEVTDAGFQPLPLGDPGALLITDLENLVFPIIRYDIGDRGRILADECACGIKLPLMAPVLGKTVDTIQLPDGTAITDINVIFDDFPEAVSAFQVIQDQRGNLEIRYVASADPGLTRRAVDCVNERVKKQVSDQVRVTMREVDQIRPRKGKLQYVFSEYKSNGVI